MSTDGLDDNLPELVNRLAPYFASTSLAQPPGASLTNTGNRTVALTNRNNASSQRIQDTTTIALVAGSLTWNFSAGFQNAPVVFAFPVGVPPSAGTSLYVSGSVATNAVVIKSTDATDTRLVMLLAVANPT